MSTPPATIATDDSVSPIMCGNALLVFRSSSPARDSISAVVTFTASPMRATIVTSPADTATGFRMRCTLS